MPNDDLKASLGRIHHLIKPENKSESTIQEPSHYRKMAEKLDGTLCSNSSGTYCRVSRIYDPHYRHGQVKVDDVSELPFSAFTVKEEEGSLDLSSLLFFDTETTGLGGSGSVAFLVGCGSIVGDSLEVRQYLIPDYSDEAAMLEALQDEFTPDKILVSFNGGAFDLPLLRSRMIINRVAREVAYCSHLDLLHTCRRLFRRRLKECTLVNLEREVLGFYRQDDIPGYLVPSVYFDWLAQQCLDGMKLVLEHNRLDIVSLFFLMEHVADIHRSDGEILTEVDDLHSLSRLYERRRRTDKVKDVYTRMNDIRHQELAEDIIFFHSLNLKRVGDWDQAVSIWVKLAESDSREGYYACLELAKYFEHRVKDFNRAYDFAIQADKINPPTKRIGVQLNKRLERLKNRLNSR